MARKATTKVTTNKCGRCGGKGYINAYNHIQGGVCFRCDGTGIGGYSFERAEEQREAEAAEFEEEMKEFNVECEKIEAETGLPWFLARIVAG